MVGHPEELGKHEDPPDTPERPSSFHLARLPSEPGGWTQSGVLNGTKGSGLVHSGDIRLQSVPGEDEDTLVMVWEINDGGWAAWPEADQDFQFDICKDTLGRVAEFCLGAEARGAETSEILQFLWRALSSPFQCVAVLHPDAPDSTLHMLLRRTLLDILWRDQIERHDGIQDCTVKPSFREALFAMRQQGRACASLSACDALI